MVHDDTAAFYDALADDYHLIFGNWEASITLQFQVITALLRDCGVTSGTVLDASCGIGTQALGLAAGALSVTATDISPASVKRCRDEAAKRGLHLSTAVADLRVLDIDDAGTYDAVLSFDNALPHLLDDEDLARACAALHRVLRPGGSLIASIRDYDAVLSERPSGERPRRFATDAGERIVFQLCDWTTEDQYDVRHFILQTSGEGYAVSERRTSYRALTRRVLSDALSAAGFEDITWRMPEETGFYQPVVTARTLA